MKEKLCLFEDFKDPDLCLELPQKDETGGTGTRKDTNSCQLLDSVGGDRRESLFQHRIISFLQLPCENN